MTRALWSGADRPKRASFVEVAVNVELMKTSIPAVQRARGVADKEAQKYGEAIVLKFEEIGSRSLTREYRVFKASKEEE